MNTPIIWRVYNKVTARGGIHFITRFYVLCIDYIIYSSYNMIIYQTYPPQNQDDTIFTQTYDFYQYNYN